MTRSPHRLLWLIILPIIMISCAQSSDNQVTPINDDPIITIPDPGDDTDTDPPADTGPSPYVMSINTGTAVYISDGGLVKSIATGDIEQADTRVFSVGSELVEYDASGDIVTADDLWITPTKIKINKNNDEYYCLEVDPDTAYSLGAQAKWYTEFTKNGVTLSPWYENQTQCADLIESGQRMFNKNAYGTYRKIDGDELGTIEHIHEERDGEPDSFIIHSADLTNRTIMFNNQGPYPFEFNYILSAKNWIYDASTDLFYSENGYTWADDKTLSENVTCLWDWTAAPFPIEQQPSNYPSLLAAGTYSGALYWVECNTGWLWRYNVSTNTQETVWRLYDGDGYHETGQTYAADLRPVFIDNFLYFSLGAAWYRLDMDTGFVELFYAGEADINEW